MRLAEEAAAPRPPRFDPKPRLLHELQRIVADLPSEAIPEPLREALTSGAVVGPEAAIWLPMLRAWLTAECRRSGGD